MAAKLQFFKNLIKNLKQFGIVIVQNTFFQTDIIYFGQRFLRDLSWGLKIWKKRYGIFPSNKAILLLWSYESQEYESCHDILSLQFPWKNYFVSKNWKPESSDSFPNYLKENIGSLENVCHWSIGEESGIFPGFTTEDKNGKKWIQMLNINNAGFFQKSLLGRILLIK